jgi:hypothetical protein
MGEEMNKGSEKVFGRERERREQEKNEWCGS